MNHKKSRLTDLFRKMDKDNNGLIPRQEFIDGILNTSEYSLLIGLNLHSAIFIRKNLKILDPMKICKKNLTA